MKKLFSIFLVLVAPFCFATDIFEEADEDEVKTCISTSIPFRAKRMSVPTMVVVMMMAFVSETMTLSPS